MSKKLYEKNDIKSIANAIHAKQFAKYQQTQLQYDNVISNNSLRRCDE